MAKCPLDDFPPELIGKIFEICLCMQNEERGKRYIEDYELLEGFGKGKVTSTASLRGIKKQVLPFQVLASHVCQYWRRIAFSIPSLWTDINFLEPAPFTKAQAYLRLSQDLPLTIHINATVSDPARLNYIFIFDSLSMALDLVVPHVERWRILELALPSFSRLHKILEKIERMHAAPLLEVLRVYCSYAYIPESESDNQKNLFVPFHGNTPRLSEVVLYHASLDWNNDMLRGVHTLELVYVTNKMSPSLASFREMIKELSQLRKLSLFQSGPLDLENKPPVHIPTLKWLTLGGNDVDYQMDLLHLLDVPNVESLTLKYDDPNFIVEYDYCAWELAKRQGRTPILGNLKELKIISVLCESDVGRLILEQLTNLRSMTLVKFSDYRDPPRNPFYGGLAGIEDIEGETSQNVYCQQLENFLPIGFTMAEIKQLVEHRIAVGFPLKRVLLSNLQEPSDDDWDWLKANLEDVGTFDEREEFGVLNCQIADEGEE